MIIKIIVNATILHILISMFHIGITFALLYVFKSVICNFHFELVVAFSHESFYFLFPAPKEFSHWISLIQRVPVESCGEFNSWTHKIRVQTPQSVYHLL